MSTNAHSDSQWHCQTDDAVTAEAQLSMTKPLDGIVRSKTLTQSIDQSINQSRALARILFRGIALPFPHPPFLSCPLLRAKRPP